MDTLKPVDHALLKVNQLSIIALNLLAFIFNQPWLAALTALIMLAGAALGKPFFALALRRVLPMRPDVLLDHPEPHRFAQGLGGIFMLAGTLLLLTGFSAPGWGLTWLVTALAALNAFGGFCAGCFVYYWLGRLGAPGFIQTPPASYFRAGKQARPTERGQQ